MISTRLESPVSAQVQTSDDTAANRTSWLDKLPAFVHDTLVTQLLLLGIIDVTKSKLETLRSITSQIAAVNEPIADSERKDQHPAFIRIIDYDYDVAHALQASTIYACDAIAERAQSLQGTTNGWDEDGITAAGISAWFFHKGRLASRDGLPWIVVSTVS
jgi:hypothetical protein